MEMKPFPNKKYNIIYADPPWNFGTSNMNNNGYGDRVETRHHYPMIKVNELIKLPIDTIAADDCVLFLWITYAHLEQAFSVINSWGFKYRTVAFEWLKLTSKHEIVCFKGRWTNGSGVELCLLARKGKLSRQSTTVRKMITAQRREHSRKPDVTRTRIVELLGDLPRIELFAREKVEGWDCWGNEV